MRWWCTEKVLGSQSTNHVSSRRLECKFQFPFFVKSSIDFFSFNKIPSNIAHRTFWYFFYPLYSSNGIDALNNTELTLFHKTKKKFYFKTRIFVHNHFYFRPTVSLKHTTWMLSVGFCLLHFEKHRRRSNEKINLKKNPKIYSLESSSQHAAQVQLVACGVKIPSSISACKLRPPYRIDRFQSLLDPRPHKFSNSLGVNHWSLNFIHRPRPPDPNRDLYNSAVVVLQRTGSTSKFMVSFQLVVHRAVVSVIVVDSWVFVAPAIDSVACCWMTICVAFISPSPTTALPEMKPLLSTHNICLKCGNWSGVMTLNAVPISEPIGRDTGTETTVLPASDVATRRVVRGATFNWNEHQRTIWFENYILRWVLYWCY